jgi:spermidine/putrescine transport system permease protein
MIANLVEVQMLKLNNKGLGSAIAIMVMLAIVSTSCLFLLMNRRILRNQ